jgi:protoporphyrin/coproporphyrin ferrochelatase
VTSSPHAPSGVLLSNLGTPRSPDAADVAAFLDEFLSDPAVVRAPRWIWLPLLRRVILPRRAPRSAELYRSIWTAEGAPLLVHSRAQQAALQAHLGERFVVELGMRYGEPALAHGLELLASRGVRRAVLVPLYPQASGTTSGTTIARARELVAERFRGIELRSAPSFPEDELYIDALAELVVHACAGAAIDHHVFSFHGLPERYVRAGDPYASECERTARALAARLALTDGRWTLSYQSKFGPGRWLEPSTKSVLSELARARQRVAVCMPGFAADCLETLEEVGIGLARAFERESGHALVVVPALDEHPRWIEALARHVERALG